MHSGTAQKNSNTGGYLQNEYILSSIGVAPINDPEIAVYVAIDSPVGTNNYGGIIHCWRKRWTCKLGGQDGISCRVSDNPSGYCLHT